MVNFKSIIFVIFCYIYIIFCLKVIFERANVTYINKKYVEYGKMNVRRYSRKSPYYLNVESLIKQEWNNNVTVSLVYKEFLHNEYRRSFIEFRNKMCILMKDHKHIRDMFARSGYTCPLPAGLVKLMNMTVNMEAFTVVWPFEKGRIEIELTTTDSGEIISTSYVDARYINERKRPRAN